MRYEVAIAQTMWCKKEVTASSKREAEEMVWSDLDHGIDAIGEPIMPASRFPGFEFCWGEGEPITTFECSEED